MKVLILADTHYDNGERDLHYPASKEAAAGFPGWLKRESSDFDLIAVCGDITVKGTSRRSELEEAKDIFDGTGKPYLIIPGNHDLCATKGMEKRYPDIEEYEYKPLEETNFYSVFKDDGTRYSRMWGGIRFIGFAIRNEDPDGQLDWLGEQLAMPGPKFVFGHYPLTPSRSGGYCLGWDYSRIDKSIGELENMIGNKESNVLAYFCGHQHINSIMPMGSTVQIETSSTVLGVTSYRVLDISDGKVRLTTHRLPYVEGTAGTLVNPDRSFDDTHSDPFEYHYGNSSDLSLEIDFGDRV